MSQSIFSPQDDNSSLASMNNEFELSSPPDNLQFSLLQIRDYYAGLAEKYTRLAEIAKNKLAHAEALLTSWETTQNDLEFSTLSESSISSSEKATGEINGQFKSSENIPIPADNIPTDIESDSSNQTWTTSEVASKLDCAVEWCNNQRYQHPDQFNYGAHYLKDEKGFIKWTVLGFEKLLKFKQAGTNIPDDVIPTKEISDMLDVSTKWISRARIKYAPFFREGTHYYYHSRQGYLWTELGLQQLRQVQANILPVPDAETLEASPPTSHLQTTYPEMLPPYQGLSQSAAVEKLLKENEGCILELDYIARILYGELRMELLKLVKNRLVKTISVGKRRGKWDGVPNEVGCYTLNWKALEQRGKEKARQLALSEEG
ncbi:MAG: hypothetical protein QNJ54_02825 [Prochloraceae cyanobacterium]|nr:hypothetical protein [Prochloraceae cyanobacterium]